MSYESKALDKSKVNRNLHIWGQPTREEDLNLVVSQLNLKHFMETLNEDNLQLEYMLKTNSNQILLDITKLFTTLFVLNMSYKEKFIGNPGGNLECGPAQPSLFSSFSFLFFFSS